MIAIAVSRADDASAHIGDHLLASCDWTETVDDARPDGEGGGTVYRTQGFELRAFDDLHLHLDGVATVFDCDPECLVFPSRHSGETGPLLTAHFTGNFGPAEYGGEDHDLAAACPNAHRAFVEALDEHAPEGYEVGMECTHHGPSDVGAPSMFVEIGSARPQWEDPEAAAAVANAILEVRDVSARRDRTLVGFGGGHYVPRFERVVRETDWAVGHVASAWALSEMGLVDHHRDVVRQAFETSGATRALIEGDRSDLKAVVEDLDYRVVSETWVRETAGVPLSVVETVERSLGTVDDGCRFGRLAGDHDADVAVESVPEALLEECHRVDETATVEAIASTTVAYDTTQNGTRAAPRVALPEDGDLDTVIAALVDVLTTDYDEVRRDGDALVVRETVFEPARAAELGVPEGPKFGKLANGQAVTGADGTVEPSDVHEDRTRRIPL